MNIIEYIIYSIESQKYISFDQTYTSMNHWYINNILHWIYKMIIRSAMNGIESTVYLIGSMNLFQSNVCFIDSTIWSDDSYHFIYFNETNLYFEKQKHIWSNHLLIPLIQWYDIMKPIKHIIDWIQRLFLWIWYVIEATR